MLRAFGTKTILDREDRTCRWAAKVKEERSNFLRDPKYKLAEDEERLLAFLSLGASRKPATRQTVTLVCNPEFRAPS